MKGHGSARVGPRRLTQRPQRAIASQNIMLLVVYCVEDRPWKTTSRRPAHTRRPTPKFGDRHNHHPPYTPQLPTQSSPPEPTPNHHAATTTQPSQVLPPNYHHNHHTGYGVLVTITTCRFTPRSPAFCNRSNHFHNPHKTNVCLHFCFVPHIRMPPPQVTEST